MTMDSVHFVRSNTAIEVPPLVPEIRLHLATEVTPIWQATEQILARNGLPPPFWAFAWAGGQALARYVLDNPDRVAGRRVLDLASGSGIGGLAAKKAGAAHVIANDVDYLATIAIALNAELNDVCVEVSATDLLSPDTTFDVANVDVVLVGDGFYDHGLSPRIVSFVHQCRAAGALVLIGDPGRADLPTELLVRVCDYVVPVTKDRQYTAAAGHGDEHDLRRATVWTPSA